MSQPKRGGSRLPKWKALMLGFGALFAADAQAKSDLPSAGTNLETSKQSGSNVDEVAIRTEGEKVYISQSGGTFEELWLGNTPEAEYLRGLLRDAGAARSPIPVPIGSIIVANGGGGVDGKKPAAPSDDKQLDRKTKQPSTNRQPDKAEKSK